MTVAPKPISSMASIIAVGVVTELRYEIVATFSNKETVAFVTPVKFFNVPSTELEQDEQVIPSTEIFNSDSILLRTMQ